jgi:acylphosphatase
MDEETLHAIIKGRVQGIGYRNWTLTKAKTLGINGWVRNMDNGCVEAVFSGAKAAVSVMLEACREGPNAAMVSSIETQPITVAIDKGFSIK